MEAQNLLAFLYMGMVDLTLTDLITYRVKEGYKVINYHSFSIVNTVWRKTFVMVKLGNLSQKRISGRNLVILRLSIYIILQNMSIFAYVAIMCHKMLNIDIIAFTWV